MSKKYNYFRQGNNYQAGDFNGDVVSAIPTGLYTVDVRDTIFGETIITFKKRGALVHDTPVELPGLWQELKAEYERFRSPEMRELYTELGLTYKRNVLFYGAPGTGKSIVINEITESASSSGVVVLFTNTAEQVKLGLEAIKGSEPDRPALVVMEEFEDWAKSQETELLTLLDGPMQFDNVMYLATTNYLDQIPPRLVRSGRFSRLIELPSLDGELVRELIDKKFAKHLSTEEIDEMVDRYLGKPIADVVAGITEYILYQRPRGTDGRS